MAYTFKYIKRPLAVLLSTISLLGLLGCGPSLYSNFRELDALHVVQTLGIDSVPGGFAVTVSTGEAGKDQPIAILSGSGDSIINGIESVRDYSPKEELYFSHVRYALLGESASASCLQDFLSYIARSPRVRLDTTLFVARCCDAKSIITSGQEDYELTAVLSSVERTIKRRGNNYAFTCREIALSLSEFGSALISAVRPADASNHVYAQEVGLTILPAGFAVIRGEGLIGWLDNDEARGACILLNKAGEGPLSFEDPQGKNISVFLEGSTAKYSADWDERGNLSRLRVNVELVAEVAEVDRELNIIEPEVLSRLSSELSKSIESMCVATLNKSREMSADFLGIFGTLRRKSPGKISKLPCDFIEALQNAEIAVEVSAKITGSYELERPAPEGKEG